MSVYKIEGQNFLFRTCPVCGIRYAMPKTVDDEHQAMGEKSEGWWCPNGHLRIYRESEADKVRRERDRLKQDAARLLDEARRAREDAEAQRRSAAAYKGAATRMKNRAKAGVCPCCNRHFVNLERHMKSRHSDEDLSSVVELGQPSKTA